MSIPKCPDLQESKKVWSEYTLYLVEKVRDFLPTEAEVSVKGCDITASWTDGPAVTDLVQLLSDDLGGGPKYWDGRYGTQSIGWYKVGLELTRTLHQNAVGYALLTALLAAGCVTCGEDRHELDEIHHTVYDATLSRKDPHLLSSHPNLEALRALGVGDAAVQHLAELLGALVHREDSGDDRIAASEAACRAGHLEGLVLLEKSLR